MHALILGMLGYSFLEGYWGMRLVHLKTSHFDEKNIHDFIGNICSCRNTHKCKVVSSFVQYFESGSYLSFDT